MAYCGAEVLMKTVGIIGGMSWESTSTYYRRLNQLVNERLGGLHSAELLLTPALTLRLLKNAKSGRMGRSRAGSYR